MDGKSLNITEEKLNQLKEIIPEAFTEGKIDWEKLKATLGDDIEFKNERYVLNWAGKSDAFRVLQSPTTATLVPCAEESVEFDDTENIFIEGENLEVLKVLQKSYFGKIKMIYIDPPYNTGNDKFIYPDKFSETKEEYLSRIGDKDETGYMTREGIFRKNSKDSGHYHSNWLSMMYPRLFLARNLLREDGVIFVSIDDNEVHNLRLLMNEVFGEENFFATLTRHSMHTVRNSSKDFNLHADFLLVYAKSKSWFAEAKERYIRQIVDKTNKYPYDDKDGRGAYKLDPLSARNYYTPYKHKFLNGVVWQAPQGSYPRYSQKTLNEMENDNRIVFSGKEPKAKRYLREVQEGQPPNTILASEDVGFNSDGTKQLREAINSDKIFSQPKPIQLIKYLTRLLRDKNSTILDFFAGSSTTAHAVLDLNKQDNGNRKFICVQLPEKCDEKSEAYKAGYKTIAEIGKERIRRVIKKIKADPQTKLDIDGATGKQDLGFKVFKLRQSNFKIWRSDVKTEEELVTQLTLHTDPVDENATIENILYELLLKSGVPLTAKIEERGGCYQVNDGEIALMLEKVNESIIKKVIAEKPNKVITLDRLFNNNDQLKTNTALQMKDAGIEFKAV